MTVALNQVANEAKLEEQILYACGLRSAEFSAYATNLESFQLLHSIFESTAQIDKSKQTPLFDVVKDYHCDWKELQSFIESILEDRYGLYVSKAFVNVLLALEKSGLTLHQVFSEFKTISEDGLRFLTNLIFASCLFPKVQSNLLHKSGGVGKKLSKFNQHLSSHDKAHATHLREVFDVDMAAKDLHSQRHEVVHPQSAHIDTHGRLEQDKREPGIRSTQAKEGTRPTQLVHDDLNHGRVLIDAHSDISNHAGKAMDGATELPRLDLVGVTEAIQIATRTIGMPTIGATEELPSLRGGTEQSEDDWGDRHDSARSSLSELDSVFTDISDVSDLDSRIEGLDPTIQEQLESFQSSYKQLTHQVSAIRDLFDAGKYITHVLAIAPTDIKQLLRFYVATNLSPETLRTAEGVFNEIKEFTVKLESSLNTKDLNNILSGINRADGFLCDLYNEMIFCAKTASFVQKNPEDLKLAQTLANGIEVLNEHIPTSIHDIMRELKLITEVQTLEEVAEFQAKYGELLTNFTNWSRANPGELADAIQGHDPAAIEKSLTDFAENSSFAKNFELDFNQAIQAFIDGELHDYTTFLTNESGKLSGLVEQLSDFKGSIRVNTILASMSAQLHHQQAIIQYVRNDLSASDFPVVFKQKVGNVTQLLITEREKWRYDPEFVWGGEGVELSDLLHVAKYANDFRLLMQDHQFTEVFNSLKTQYKHLGEQAEALAQMQQKIDQEVEQIVADLTPLELSIWAKIRSFFSSIWDWLTV